MRAGLRQPLFQPATLALGPAKIENFNDILLVLENSPCLEHLYLHQGLVPGKLRTIVLRESAKFDHLKTLSLWRFTAEEITALLHSVTLPQHGLAMRLVDIQSEDLAFAYTYPLDIPPHLSIFTATKLQIEVTQLYCCEPCDLEVAGERNNRRVYIYIS